MVAAVRTQRTLSLVWGASRGQACALGLLTLVTGLVPLGIAYVGKSIVDAVVTRDRNAVVHWVLAELLLVALVTAAQRGIALTRHLLGARLGVEVTLSILKKALRLDLHFFEQSAFYDKLLRARGESSTRPLALVTSVLSLVQSVITLTGSLVFLLQFSGWAALALCIATIPVTLSEARSSKLTFRLRNWRSPEARRLMYIEHVLGNDSYTKEVKLYGLGPLLLGRYTALSDTLYKEDRALHLRKFGLTQALSFAATVTFYGVYALMALLAAGGKLTLGNMTLYLFALRQGQQALQSSLAAIGDIYESNLYMSNLWDFLAIDSERRTETARQLVASPCRETRGSGIQLVDVGFRYPDKSEWALRHLNLSIPPGARIALVGQNGAGKTTLVKLLTRLYEPTEGHILLDGVDLGAWNADALRRRFAVLFQDFNKYQLKLRENVGIGSVDHMDDEERICRAVDRGGASDLVAELGCGLDEPLGFRFEEGRELSGGQWQKVALARSFMREEADILVLDEPTAALDAEAESAVLTRFRALAQGRTTLIISHKFSAVRLANHILVLERGQIIESGSHEDLMARDGRYAQMFAMQAEGFR